MNVSESCQFLYGRVEIGSTGTILGIYKIMAALKVLRRWTDDVFRPWFDNILLRRIIHEKNRDS